MNEEIKLEISFKEHFLYLEKKIRESVKSKNAEDSHEYLRKIMRYLFEISEYDIKKIKVRLMELLVLISRGSINPNVDPEKILDISEHYFYEIEKFDTQTELTVTMANAINRLISYNYDFSDVDNMSIISKAVVYIKNNYNRKIGLEDVAKHVHLSKSYLCRAFKSTLSTNISNYINEVRIEKSKELMTVGLYNLSEIMKQVGFEDQSYFTKVFKKHVGMSPGQFKKVLTGLNSK